MLLDGSDVGLGAADVDAAHRLDDGSLLLSLNIPLDVPGLGPVDDSDILRFVPETLGKLTSGRLELWFDGSAADLTTPGEDVDAIALTPDGELVVSTSSTFVVPAGSGQDEDLIKWDGAEWALYFDGSDVGWTPAPTRTCGARGSRGRAAGSI